MMFQRVTDMVAAVEPAAAVIDDRVTVGSAAALSGHLVDRLVWTAVFGSDAELRGTARWILRSIAAAAGIQPASIHDLYVAMGRSQAGGFTVPAFNLRAMSYDMARAVFRAAAALRAGALILEISRSEMSYTAQRPHEYAAVVIGAALREGYGGPVFLQGDHVQVDAKKYQSPDREQELQALRALVEEELAAGFYNIDIDASTLVDLEQPSLRGQQAANAAVAADFTAFIRRHEPPGITVSVGGEIGEVGGRNSNVNELRAFMDGYREVLRRHGDHSGISKISVQTGTEHGGFVDADGKVRTDVKIDLETLGDLSRVARTEYGLAGAVQHGASTLPPDAFDAFPRAGACEIHLATDFQNVMYDHPHFPAGLKSAMYEWVRQHAAADRRPPDSDQQFIYRARKKAIGRFQRELWSLNADVREAIGSALEDRFAFLMRRLNVADTAAVVAAHVRPVPVAINRDAEIAAARTDTGSTAGGRPSRSGSEPLTV
jgi:fructose-bisphosphate aldolase class II